MDNDGDQALKVAEEVLLAEGFKLSTDGKWAGNLQVDEVDVALEITFPKDFPQLLPEIRVDRRRLPRRVPHVEHDGKLCLIPAVGTLIDAHRPAEIVRDSLRKAQKLLSDGLSGRNESDLVDEFLGYWNPGCTGIIESICKPRGLSREIYLLRFRFPGSSEDQGVLAADDLVTGQKWLAHLSWQFVSSEAGWFHVLTDTFLPPDFDSRFLTRHLIKAVRSASSDDDCSGFQNWLVRTGLPRTVVFCMPALRGNGSILFGAKLNRASGDQRKEALKGYREPSLPVLRDFYCSLHQPATRIQVERFDPEYVLPRSGANTNLRDKTVVVVGCGAIGSLLTEKIAALGVGTIRLVDHDTLSSENIYRHALGVEYFGKNKAKAMQTALGKRFPNLVVEPMEERIQTVLKDKPDFLLKADLICIALGDETVELWLNDLIGNQIPRIHIWIEPLGIGGHVLATGCAERDGCYRCLFRDDAAIGLINGSAFALAGQTFGRSLAGCSGTFTPFTCLDADRIAAEAAKVAAGILTGQARQGVLVSWFGGADVFREASFRLSSRAEMFKSGEVKSEYNFKNPGCECGQWSK